MALITSLFDYNKQLNIEATNNEKVYKVLDTNQTDALIVLWNRMVLDAKEANNTGNTMYVLDDEDSAPNYSWSSC